MNADDVKELRARRNLTPTALAKITGLKRTAIQRMEETGEITEQERQVLVLAGAFDSPPAEATS